MAGRMRQIELLCLERYILTKTSRQLIHATGYAEFRIR